MKHITRHYIHGHFVESHGTEVMDLTNPTDRTVIGRVTLGDVEDARMAIRAAKEAFNTFAVSLPEERCHYLQRLHDSILNREKEHVAIRTLEYGGVPLHNEFAIRGSAKLFLNMKKTLEAYPIRRKIGQAEVVMKPVGVAGLITPWNSAIFMVCNKLSTALAAGCTVIVKPSELSALQTQLLLECIDDAGLPPGVVNVVNGRGGVVGAELVRHPDVQKISFTGSTAVGKEILRNSADTIKRVTLELGGKSAHIFLEDANIESAVTFALEAGFRNNGQACLAGTRILVPQSKLEEVKTAFLRALSHWKVGKPTDENTAIGPLVSESQYQRVQRYIRNGIEEGAELLAGGEGHPDGLESGWFVKPTIFVNVKSDMTIAREEIFGPVLSLITYETEEEAIRIANNTIYGLHGYISTSNRDRGRKVAERIEAGAVMVNHFYDLLDEAGIPAGGFKQSGIGREFGAYGLQAYLEPQSIFA